MSFDGISRTVIPQGSKSLVASGDGFVFRPVYGWNSYTERFWYGGGRYSNEIGNPLADSMLPSPGVVSSTDLVTVADKYDPTNQTYSASTYLYGFSKNNSPQACISVVFGYKTLPASRESLIESRSGNANKANISYDPVTDSIRLKYLSVVLEISNCGIVPGEWYQVTYVGTPSGSASSLGINLELRTPSATRKEYDPYWGGVNLSAESPTFGRGTEGVLQGDGYNYFSGYMRNYYQAWNNPIPETNRFNPGAWATFRREFTSTYYSAYATVSELTDTGITFDLPDMPVGTYDVFIDYDLFSGNVDTFPESYSVEIIPPILAYLADPILDGGLNYMKNNITERYICAGNPTDRVSAIAASVCSLTGLTPASFTDPVDGDTSGRKITKLTESGDIVESTGMGDTACYCSATDLIWRTDAESPQLLTAGGTVNTTAHDHENLDAI